VEGLRIISIASLNFEGEINHDFPILIFFPQFKAITCIEQINVEGLRIISIASPNFEGEINHDFPILFYFIFSI
jgi:hypothetical protein